LHVQTVCAHSAFVGMIPHGPDVPGSKALGHLNGKGAGALSKFGEDFKANDYVWDDALCLLDSDGDGETNGMELGDPCCLWRNKGNRNVPMVEGQILSNPGDATRKTGNFPPPVFARNDLINKVAALTLEGSDRLSLFTQAGFQCPTLTEECKPGWWKDKYGKCKQECSVKQEQSRHANGRCKCGMSPPNQDCDPGQTCKNHQCANANEEPPAISESSFSLDDLYSGETPRIALFVLNVAFYTVILKRKHGGVMDFMSNQWTLASRATIGAFALCFTEVSSGLLHITADNPAFLRTPFFGSLADGFQGHHEDPSGISRLGWFDFLTKIDAGMVLLLSFTFAHQYLPIIGRESRVLNAFTIFTVPMMYLMMATHRWTHCPPEDVPLIANLLQATGLILPITEHNIHHSDYSRNFSLLTGWSNGLFNMLTASVMGPKDTKWMSIFICWAISWPLALSRVSTRSASKAQPQKDPPLDPSLENEEDQGPFADSLVSIYTPPDTTKSE